MPLLRTPPATRSPKRPRAPPLGLPPRATNNRAPCLSPRAPPVAFPTTPSPNPAAPQLGDDFGIRNDTIGLAMSYFDRFLSAVPLDKADVQLAAVACVLVAAKFGERRMPALADLVFVCQGKYSADDIRRAESDVIKSLGWQLHAVTPHMFCAHFLRAAVGSPERASSVFRHAEFFVDLSFYGARPPPRAREPSARRCPPVCPRRRGGPSSPPRGTGEFPAASMRGHADARRAALSTHARASLLTSPLRRPSSSPPHHPTPRPPTAASRRLFNFSFENKIKTLRARPRSLRGVALLAVRRRRGRAALLAAADREPAHAVRQAGGRVRARGDRARHLPGALGGQHCAAVRI